MNIGQIYIVWETRDQKKTWSTPCKVNIWAPFKPAYSFKMFSRLCACIHSCTAQSCKHGFGSSWRDKRSWRISNAAAEVSPCQSRRNVGSVCRCRCQPAGNPATLWLWSILLAGVAQYLSAKSLAWALLLHPFYFVLFWKTPWSLSRRAGALLNSPRAVSPTQNILKTNRQTALDLPQTINPFFFFVFVFMQSVYFVCGHLIGFILCHGSVKQANSRV